jgi:hypothetical protein
MTKEWIAPAVERSDPDRVSEERTALEQWMDFHRATLMMKCAGLTSDQLKERALPPSNLSLLGLVRHMQEVERWWFRMNADQQDLPFLFWVGDDEADFDDVESADATADLENFWAEVHAAKLAMESHSLDEIVPSAGHHAGRSRNIRWIFIHMIEEYARHNGHADLLREKIDGSTGD